MTDNEITKALECCFIKVDCTDCPCHEGKPFAEDCLGNVAKKALDLITRQKAEIERLKYVNKYLRFRIGIKTDEQLKDIIAETETTEKHIKAEAIKEFAERLKQKARFCLLDFNKITDTNEGVQAIDNLVKEMVGEE